MHKYLRTNTNMMSWDRVTVFGAHWLFLHKHGTWSYDRNELKLGWCALTLYFVNCTIWAWMCVSIADIFDFRRAILLQAIAKWNRYERTLLHIFVNSIAIAFDCPSVSLRLHSHAIEALCWCTPRHLLPIHRPQFCENGRSIIKIIVLNTHTAMHGATKMPAWKLNYVRFR